MINVLTDISHEAILNALEYIDMEVDKEDSHLALSVGCCIQNSNLETKDKINIIIDGIDGIRQSAMIHNLDLLKTMVSNSTNINILITGSNSEHSESTKYLRVETTTKSLNDSLKSSQLKADLIIGVGMDFIKTNNLLDNKVLYSLKNSDTKFYMGSPKSQNLTNNLIHLAKFNVKESQTIINNFAYDDVTNELLHKVTLLDLSGITNQIGYYVDESVIRQMINNTYFDKSYNVFGLHHTFIIGDTNKELIAFDPEYYYCCKENIVYKINETKFTVVEELEKDPFPSMTRKLKKETYSTNDNVSYIPLKHKENAVNIRLHFDHLVSKKIRPFRDSAKQELIDLGVIPSKNAINVLANNISNGVSLRNTTTQDVSAYKMYHHFRPDFIKSVEDMPIMYHAKNLLGNELIFEIVKNDEDNELLENYLQQTQLNINKNLTDSHGLSLLETCIEADAFNNAVTLLINGSDVNFQSPLGFTALHRAYANGCVEGVIILNECKAKQLKNIFGKTPLDIMPEGFEKLVLERCAS
jgi:hypothetical protein